MSPRVTALADRFRAEARALVDGPIVLPELTPEGELRRSPAAARVGRLAAEAGLLCFHFEHRVHLPLPEAWVPEADPSLADPPTWDAGVLPERKYQSFRHDLPIGSFHPHHRAKWSTHELCHGLVGFAWHPQGTPLFHALAGRLAELLPVVLWYFLDETCLRRCEDHLAEGALFRTFCPACERVAAAWPDDPHAEARLDEGLRFLDAELAAIARSRRLGRPIPHRWATIDLSSDGVAYARAHAERLTSPVFHRYMERFAVAGGGWSPSLDELEARVLDVAAGLLGEREPAPLAPSARHGRWRWVAQDLGWRLHHIAADTEGEAAAGLDRLAEQLAALIPATTDPTVDVQARGDAALEALVAGYEALYVDFDLPPVEDVLAVGYPLGAATRTPVDQLLDGLSTCSAVTIAALEDRARAVVARFAAEDPPRRAHLATRWADWLAARHPGPLAELARWEQAAVRVPPHAPAHLDGPPDGDGWCLADGAEVHAFSWDVLRLAERADAGELTVRELPGGRLTLTPIAGPPLEEEEVALVLGRDPHGELLVLDVDPESGRALAAGRFDAADLEPDELDALAALRVIRPVRWRLLAP